MEVQGPQEALKVELQCHQNQTLCKGLNELQNGQKLSVRTCPVGTTKPLSLIKPSTQGIAISVVPAKAPVSMVTAHMNGQKAASSEPLQTSPINLQMAGRAATGAVHAFSSRRAVELPSSQMLGTLTALPIKVPTVSSLHQLEGQAATLLPQVRPKTQIPDSLPHSPCQELQPLSLQRATAVVSPKSQGATLPTANSTFSPDHQPSGQSGDSSPQAPPHGPVGGIDSGSLTQHASAGPGVAYAIIAASPATGNGVTAVSEAVKVIIIQPQAASSGSTEASPGIQADLPSQEAPPTPKSPSLKKDEDPEKIAFMVALGLVTTEHLEEIQLKRQERKRRSTANPAYSGLFEPERKRLASHYLNSSLYLSARDTEDLCWKEEVEHDDHCAVCKEDGELQPCHNCPRAFHPNCLYPPLKTPPRGPWYCPKCQKKVLNKENMSWPQNFVQSYVTHKTVRQEEKRRLLRRNSELKKACVHLEEQDKELNDTIEKCRDARERLLSQQRDAQASLDRLKSLVRLIQRDQLIQVTMTTTATIAAASLLSQSCIKATSTVAAAQGALTTPLQKSHAHSQDNN
ncbi:PHD finger protein 21B isoform X2 [Solea senegalensis]|uniref:PHD finger protein 21B isoform X2 n=1 Tax=Solea senegalensis TaxID=28829 RepID=A0AAV6PIL2_SOLSE|nr:PHD finger protein 21B isoform X1 [Solea senegalensis]KAG7464392.1 PHD finger protein 21B isoform X2 [Solea senegalensis]